MFSNKYRLLKIIIPLFIIVMSIVYAQIKGPQLFPGFLEAKKEPQKYIGKEISFGGKIINISPKQIIIDTNGVLVKVNLEVTKYKIKYNISGTAIFQKDQSLSPVKYHLSNLRGYKIFLSLIPFLIITFLFIKNYKL